MDRNAGDTLDSVLDEMSMDQTKRHQSRYIKIVLNLIRFETRKFYPKSKQRNRLIMNTQYQL
jgi:hypothetical protein